MITVEGGWNIMYVMKNTSVATDCSKYMFSKRGQNRVRSKRESYVAGTGKLQFLEHARNGGGRQVRPVHQTDTIQDAHQDDQPAVDPPDDPLPFLLVEFIVDNFGGLGLFSLEMPDVELCLFLVAVHD